MVKVIEADYVLERIHASKTVVKVIRSCSSPAARTKFDDKEGWNYIANILEHPDSFRPTYWVYHKKTYKLNTFTGAIERRGLLSRIGKKLHRSPRHTHSKKTAVTAVPSHGKVSMFQPTYTDRSGKKKFNIGLLFDVDKLRLKTDTAGNPLYIFRSDCGTNRKWWVSDYKPVLEQMKTYYEQQGLLPTPTLTELYTEINSTDIAPLTEILACLSKEALLAVVVPTDDTEANHEGLIKQQYIRDVFGIELPILIHSCKKGITLYNEKIMKSDIKALEKKDSSPDFLTVIPGRSKLGKYLCLPGLSNFSILKLYISKILRQKLDDYAKDQCTAVTKKKQLLNDLINDIEEVGAMTVDECIAKLETTRQTLHDLPQSERFRHKVTLSKLFHITPDVELLLTDLIYLCREWQIKSTLHQKSTIRRIK